MPTKLDLDIDIDINLVITILFILIVTWWLITTYLNSCNVVENLVIVSQPSKYPMINTDFMFDGGYIPPFLMGNKMMIPSPTNRYRIVQNSPSQIPYLAYADDYSTMVMYNKLPVFLKTSLYTNVTSLSFSYNSGKESIDCKIIPITDFQFNPMLNKMSRIPIWALVKSPNNYYRVVLNKEGRSYLANSDVSSSQVSTLDGKAILCRDSPITISKSNIPYVRLYTEKIVNNKIFQDDLGQYNITKTPDIIKK